MFTLVTLTASGDKSSRLFHETLPWLLVLLGAVIAGGVIILIARRSLKASSGGDKAAGFTLQDLRDLHAAGELNDEEFARAKAQMIGRLRADKPAKPDGPGTATAQPPPNNPPPTRE